MNWPINYAGVRLLKEFESFTSYPYPDPASPLGRATHDKVKWGHRPPAEILSGLPAEQRRLSGAPWTIGWGFTDGVKADDVMSLADGDARLARELVEYVEGVERALTRPANENQLAAMVVLAWNIGIKAFAGSSVCKAHNRGDCSAASRAFGLWNKAGGRVMRGLTRRRAAESALYLRPALSAVQREAVVTPAVALDVPDIELELTRPDPERPMLSSKIVQGAGAAGSLSALTLAAEGARAVGEIRYSLGDWLPYVALGAVMVIAGWIVWERVKQRRAGVA